MEHIVERDGINCWICGIETTPTPKGIKWKKGTPHPQTMRTIDHVVPKADGGTYRSKNLKIACFKCNSSRYTPFMKYSEVSESKGTESPHKTSYHVLSQGFVVHIGMKTTLALEKV